jgi:hypothetical protein
MIAIIDHAVPDQANPPLEVWIGDRPRALRVVGASVLLAPGHLYFGPTSSVVFSNSAISVEQALRTTRSGPLLRRHLARKAPRASAVTLGRPTGLATFPSGFSSQGFPAFLLAPS